MLHLPRICIKSFTVARISFLYINLLMALFLTLPVLQAREKTFTVVIDAGHGGKDLGLAVLLLMKKLLIFLWL